MPHPLIDKIKNYAAGLPQLRLQVTQQALGLAHDFWQDGTDNPWEGMRLGIAGLIHKIKAKAQTPTERKKIIVPRPARASAIWQALPGEVAEKMWGDGAVLPGDTLLTDTMVLQLQLGKTSKVLDLSAGLGTRMRKVGKLYGADVTGMEIDPNLAERGTELMTMLGKRSKVMPIAPYDPAHFSLHQFYDCVLAREVFYRIADKESFFRAVTESSNPKAQLAFTDYIVNPENAGNPAIKAWQVAEKATPLGLVEMAELWARAGFMISVHDDQTEFYRKEIMFGLQRLAVFLGSGAKPDAATKQDILRQTESWVRRASALQNGLKFYRFYGAKG